MGLSHELTRHFGRPGKPTDHAVIESFNTRAGAERRNAYGLETPGEAREPINARRMDYNAHRPHRAYGNFGPRGIAFASRLARAVEAKQPTLRLAPLREFAHSIGDSPMLSRTWPAIAAALLATLGVSLTALASSVPRTQPDGLGDLDGEWIFVEDRTEGRGLEQLGPPMASRFSMRVEDGAVVLNGHGSGHKDVRIALDGSKTEVTEPKTISRYRGSWKDGTFEYEVAFERPAGAPEGSIRMIRRSFRVTADGLLVRVAVEPSSGPEAVGVYRHAEDIAMPAPAKATIGDLAWLAHAWVGRRSSGSSIEERWSPPLGGAMLAVSRTINTSGKMVAFEYLRIVERDDGLVYIAQPGGAQPTEFVLTETGATRAVFENPRHDYPKRIVYELSAEGGLIATIGQTRGGTPRRFEFTREGD
ncbi:MAG: transposase [Phycisphaerae bacterium]|nr:transposase [Phycisphaerae bacterium]